jgi:hypothetical protein
MSWMRAYFDEHRRAATAITVILAVVLLLAAGFMTMNLLQDGPTTASSTQVPSPTTAVVPSETESSTQPSSGAIDQVTFGRVFAGVVLVNNLRVREEPVDGAVRATLQTGDIVRMQGDPRTIDGSDWYQIQSRTDTYGWVSAGPEGQYLELHRRVAQQVPATVEGVAGGPSGYLAWGVSAGRESEHRDRFVAVSEDGATWRLGTVPAAASAAAFVAADYGPAGWLLAASNADNTAIAGFWHSPDGLSWEAIGANLGPSMGIRSIVGSASGYLADMWDYRSGDTRATAFASRDGSNWSEVDAPPEVYPVGGADAGDGFVIWAEQPDAPAFILYSPDGTTWLDPSRGGMHPGPTDTPIAIAVTGRRFIAITVVQSTGPMKVWTATLPAESDANWPALEWTRQPSAEAQLAAMAVGRLEALDGHVLAFGNAYDTGELLAWSTTDGASWDQLAIGALGRTAELAPMAVGELGLVGVAHDVTAAGNHPRFWHSTDGANWQGEASPAIKPVEHAVIGACPERPSTMLDWMAVPGAVGAECFGDEPITFRAWHTVGGGCGGFAPGIFEPGWLASQFAILALEFTPNEVEYTGCGTAAVHPDLVVPAAQQWVQVTGHWADSASATCRMLPDPLYPGAPVGGSLVFECRSKFVATALAPSP